MTVHLNDEDALACIEALRYVAHNEAGQTQEPYLCGPEDYEEFELAARLERRMAASVKQRAMHDQYED